MGAARVSISLGSSCVRSLVRQGSLIAVSVGDVHAVTVIPGDGVGPELIKATCRVLEATGVTFAWDAHLAGATALAEHGRVVPLALMNSFARTRVGLKGPVATPVGSGFRSFNVELRRELDLFAAIRPCKTVADRGLAPRCDLVVVRENQEDLYAGIEFAQNSRELMELRALVDRHGLGTLAHDAGVTLKVITRRGAERLLRCAFDYCRAHGRRRLTVGHKANILVETDLAFLDAAQRIGRDYPEVTLHDSLIDTLCGQLIRAPETFDVVALPNLYGDIVSDLGAVLSGGVGMAPGMNAGPGGVMFEAVHGVALKRAGRDRANPLALIRCGVMLLEHVGEQRAAAALDAAITRVVRRGAPLTDDVVPGSTAGTSTVIEAVLAELAAGSAVEVSVLRPGHAAA